MAMILQVMFRYGALFLFSLLWAQGSVTATEPSLQVCGPNGTVNVTVFNTGGSPLTGVQLAVQMPPGVEYVPGTVTPGTVTEISTTPANQPVFGVPDLPPGSDNITFQVRATCDVIPFLSDENNQVKNTYTLTWSGGGSASYTSAAEYTITQPSLQYQSIDNQTFSASTLPQTFTRIFRVTNAGTAPLSSFRHLETSGSSVTIVSSSGGTVITHTAHNLVLEFSGSDFGSNNLFDPGETVTFTVTYQVTSCNAAASNFSLTWGCYSQTCQTVNETGGVDFASLTPNLNHYRLSFIQESSCYGDAPAKASQGRLRIKNIGLGPAKDIEVDLYIVTWPAGVFAGAAYDRIDTNSITLRIGSGGAPLPRIITSAQSGTVHGCFTATNVVKRLKLYIAGPLNPGDTLFIDFNLYTCELPQSCPTTTSTSHFHFHGIGGNVSYKSLCDASYTHEINIGSARIIARAPLTGSGPGTVSNGQVFSYCFGMQTDIGSIFVTSPDGRAESGSPSDPNNYRFIWTIQLPATFVYTGAPIQWVSGSASWPASSINLVGNTLTITFDAANRPAGWTTSSFRAASLCVPLQATCGTTGVYPIIARLSYNPNTTCNPSPGYCLGIPTIFNVAINCPMPCPDGVDFITFEVKRISYGLPDHNNDGQPSGTTYNFAQMRLDRLMHTDTAEAYFGGRIRTTTFQSWQNVWVILEAGNQGDRLTGLNAEVTIRKSGNGPVYAFTRPVTTSSLCGGFPHCNRIAQPSSSPRSPGMR